MNFRAKDIAKLMEANRADAAPADDTESTAPGAQCAAFLIEYLEGELGNLEPEVHQFFEDLVAQLLDWAEMRYLDLDFGGDEDVATPEQDEQEANDLLKRYQQAEYKAQRRARIQHLRLLRTKGISRQSLAMHIEPLHAACKWTKALVTDQRIPLVHQQAALDHHLGMSRLYTDLTSDDNGDDKSSDASGQEPAPGGDEEKAVLASIEKELAALRQTDYTAALRELGIEHLEADLSGWEKATGAGKQHGPADSDPETPADESANGAGEDNVWPEGVNGPSAATDFRVRRSDEPRERPPTDVALDSFCKTWDESKHPRGQPGNPGQLAPSLGGAKAPEEQDAAEHASKPTDGVPSGGRSKPSEFSAAAGDSSAGEAGQEHTGKPATGGRGRRRTRPSLAQAGRDENATGAGGTSLAAAAAGGGAMPGHLTAAARTALSRLGLTDAEITQLMRGNSVGFNVARAPVGTTGIAQLVEGRLRIGIFTIKNEMKTGLRDFLDFDASSRAAAKALGAKEVEIMGIEITNTRLEQVLRFGGFNDTTIPAPAEAGGGVMKAISKIEPIESASANVAESSRLGVRLARAGGIVGRVGRVLGVAAGVAAPFAIVISTIDAMNKYDDLKAISAAFDEIDKQIKVIRLLLDAGNLSKDDINAISKEYLRMLRLTDALVDAASHIHLPGRAMAQVGARIERGAKVREKLNQLQMQLARTAAAR